jgi:rhomboid protease GluP
MGRLGAILRGALEACVRLLDALGARGARWEWKKQVWRRDLEEWIGRWENLERGVRSRMRMCRECRTLVEGAAATCPACGASMRGIPKGGLGRLLGIAAPEAVSVTSLLLTANVAMSLITVILATRSGGSFGAQALLSPPGAVLFLLGSKWTQAIAQGQIWRLVTAGYLHVGLLHLLFNSYSLVALGPLVESSFGRRKFFLIYSVTGICAFAASAVFRPYVHSAGASGSLFGLMGFILIYGRFRGGSVGRAVADQLMRWAILGVVMSLFPGIDLAAHFGGFAAGAVLGLVVDPGEPRTRAGVYLLNLLSAAAVLGTLAAFVAMVLSYPANLGAIGG